MLFIDGETINWTSVWWRGCLISWERKRVKWNRTHHCHANSVRKIVYHMPEMSGLYIIISDYRSAFDQQLLSWTVAKTDNISYLSMAIILHDMLLRGTRITWFESRDSFIKRRACLLTRSKSLPGGVSALRAPPDLDEVIHENWSLSLDRQCVCCLVMIRWWMASKPPG